MTAFPTFPLFADPLRENVFAKSIETCECCGKQRDWKYTGPIYGEGVDDPTLCPWCIADGSAAAKINCFFNDVLVKLNSQDLELVEKRTPGYTTWQGNHWLGCCGRACIYLGEAEERDLRGPWASAVDSIVGELGYTKEKLWEDILPGLQRAGSVCVYVFQCRECRKLSAYWDMD